MSELTAKENIKTADTVKRITATAVMAALTTLMTAYIFHIPVGVNGGYVHLGDTMIYLAAAFLPLPYACAAGAIGGGLADLLTAPVWAPATIIIKMLICLPFSSKGTKLVTKRNVVALLPCIRHLSNRILYCRRNYVWIYSILLYFCQRKHCTVRWKCHYVCDHRYCT